MICLSKRKLIFPQGQHEHSDQHNNQPSDQPSDQPGDQPGDQHTGLEQHCILHLFSRVLSPGGRLAAGYS